MDLSDLKSSLAAKAGARQPAAGMQAGGAPESGLVAEIYARHLNSRQSSSKQLCAILTAVLEVLKAEALQPTPTALFAALMSSLEKPSTRANLEVGPRRGRTLGASVLMPLWCLLPGLPPSPGGGA